MKQKLLNNFLLRAVMLVAVLWSAGVSPAVAADAAYKTLSFPDDNSSNNKKSSYTATWTAKKGSDSWSIANFNNNSWGDSWTYIKCGSKTAASTATITTDAAIDAAIKKVAVTIDAITASNVTSIKLYTGSDGKNWTEAGSFDKTTGTKEVTLTTPTANLYYKVEFVCTKASKNGIVQVSKVEYFKADDSTPSATLTSLSITSDPTKLTYYVGDTFETAGVKVTGTYSDASEVDVTDKATITATPSTLAAGTTSVTVKAEYDGKDVSKDYNVTVNARPTHTATFSVNGTAGTPASYEVGAAITFPEDPADIDGKTFVGWTSTAIDGTTDEVPTTVTSAVMGNGDVTFYAVFATKETTSGTVNKTVSITASDFTSLSGSYSETSTTKTVNGSNYTITIQACKQNDMIQMRDNTTLSYIYFPELPGKITNITTTQCNNAGTSAYSGTIHIKSSKTRGNADTNDITKWTGSNATSFSIDLTGDNKSFYLLTSAGLRLKDLTVTYQESGSTTTYSDYCTTITATTVEKPVLSVAAGAVAYGTKVTVSNYDDNLLYFYTTDGSTPACDEMLDPIGTTQAYTDGITITGAVTIKVIATDEDANMSSVATAAYTIQAPEAPVISVDAGTYSSEQSIEITAAEGMTIYYTLDGTTPTTESTEYTAPITISEDCTLKAIAVDGGGNASAVASAAYVFKMVKDGVFDFENKFSDYGSGVETTSEGTTYIYDDKTWTAGNVTLVSSGKYRWWDNDGTLRFYNNTPQSKMTISVPDGYVITKIVLTGGTTFTADAGTYDSGTWTGLAQSVVLTYAADKGSVNVKAVTVTYAPAAPTITVGSTGYASYVTTQNVSIPTEDGMTAYIVTAVGSTSITLSEVLDAPKGAALIIKAAEGTYTFGDDYASLFDDVVDETPNLLKASDGSITGDGKTIYALGNKDGVGFYVVADGVKVPAGKAYLTVAASVKEFLSFDFGGGVTTGVKAVAAGETPAYQVYNLAGQRVNKATKGIYVVNGKKVLVK